MKNKGFTLIELLVTISIIGILAVVIIASLGQARTRSKDAAVMSTLSSYRTEIELEYPTGNYSGLCSSGLVSDMSTYISEKGGALDVCDADAQDYILVATLPSGNQTSNVFETENAFAQTIPEFSGDELFCINAKGTAIKVTAAEFENMLTYASNLTDPAFNSNILSPYCSLSELQVDLGIIEEVAGELNFDQFQPVCSAYVAMGVPESLTTTGCMGMDSVYMAELLSQGVDQMTAGIQASAAVDPSFCSGVTPDPMYEQLCGEEEPEYQYTRTCHMGDTEFLPPSVLSTGCVGLDPQGAQLQLMVLLQQYANEHGAQPETNSPEFIELMLQAFSNNSIAADPGMCAGELACPVPDPSMRACANGFVLPNGEYLSSPHTYNGAPYCGFFQQDQFEANLAYALEDQFDSLGYYPEEGTPEYHYAFTDAYILSFDEDPSADCSSLPVCPS